MASSDEASAGTFAIGSSSANDSAATLSVSNSSDASGTGGSRPPALPAIALLPSGGDGVKSPEMSVGYSQDSNESEWEIPGGMQRRRVKSLSAPRSGSHGPITGKLAIKDTLRKPRPLTPRSGSLATGRTSLGARSSREGMIALKDDEPETSRRSDRSRSPTDDVSEEVEVDVTKIVEGAMKVAQQAQSRLTLSQQQNAHLAHVASTATDAAVSASQNAAHYQSEALMQHQNAEHHAQQSVGIARESMERTAIVGAAHLKLQDELAKAQAELQGERDAKNNSMIEAQKAEINHRNLQMSEAAQIATLQTEQRELVEAIRMQDRQHAHKQLEIINHNEECNALRNELGRVKQAAIETHQLAINTEKGVVDAQWRQVELGLKSDLATMGRKVTEVTQMSVAQEQAALNADLERDLLKSELSRYTGASSDIQGQQNRQLLVEQKLRTELNEMNLNIMETKQVLTAQEQMTKQHGERAKHLQDEVQTQNATYRILYDEAAECMASKEEVTTRAEKAEKETGDLKLALVRAEEENGNMMKTDKEEVVSRDHHEKILDTVKSELMASLRSTATRLKAMKDMADKASHDAEWFRERNEDLEGQIQELQAGANMDQGDKENEGRQKREDENIKTTYEDRDWTILKRAKGGNTGDP